MTVTATDPSGTTTVHNHQHESNLMNGRNVERTNGARCGFTFTILLLTVTNLYPKKNVTYIHLAYHKSVYILLSVLLAL